MNNFKKNILRKLIDKSLDVELLLDLLGITYKVKGNELMARCPHSEHNDRVESWSFNINKKKHNCWSCPFGGDAVDLVMEVLNLTEDDAIKYLRKNQKDADPEETMYDISMNEKLKLDVDEIKEFNIHLPNQFKVILSRNNEYYKYLHERGISDNIIKKYGLGYCDKYQSKQGELNYSYRVIVPVMFKNKLYTFFARNNDMLRPIDKKWRGLYPAGPLVSRILWPYNDIDYSLGYIILVEGPFDALRLISLGYKNVMCVFGNKVTEKQSELIRDIKSKMDSFELITIPDADGELELKMINGTINIKKSIATKGQLLILSILKNLPGMNFTIVKLPEGEDPGSVDQELLESLFFERKKFLKTQKTMANIDYTIYKP